MSSTSAAARKPGEKPAYHWINERARKRSLARGAPTRPGVYLFRDRHGQVLYVGRARDLRARLRSYFRSERQRPSVEAALLALDRIEWRVLGSDPEIPVNIVDLGLIYEIAIKPQRVDVKMTLTALGCPMAGEVMGDVRDHLLTLPGVEDAGVELVYDPPWTPERMSEEARWELGMV